MPLGCPSQKEIRDAITAAAAIDAQKTAALASAVAMEEADEGGTVSIYRAPRRGYGQFELDYGYVGRHYGSGRIGSLNSAFFAKEESVCRGVCWQWSIRGFCD